MDIKDKKAFLFDLDGTLINSLDYLFEAWYLSIKNVTGKKITKKQYFLTEGMGVQRTIIVLGKEHKINSKDYPRILEMKNSIFEEKYKFSTYKYANEILDFLSHKKIKRGLVTGADRLRIEKNIPSFFLDKFNGIITPDDVQETKPSPAPYLACAKILGFSPEQCVVVENAPLGVVSAKKANMFCIAITNTLKKKYLEDADIVIDRLSMIEEMFSRS